MRFVKWTIGLLLLSIIAIGLIVVIAHVNYPDGACLLYDTRDTQGGDITAIDPTNGNQYIYHRAPAYLPQYPQNGDLSPDGRHEIYLTGPQQGPYSLYIDPKPLKQQDGYLYCFNSVSCWIGEKPPNPQARVIASSIQAQFTGIWLDNDRLAYSVPVDNQKQTLVVERIDGSNQYRLPMTFDQHDVIAIRSWDDSKIVFVVSQGTTNGVYIWSLPDGRFISYPSLSNNPDIVPSLSPQGKYVTVIDHGRLSILNAATQERHDFALPQNKSVENIDWAPNEHYLGVQYQDNAYQRHHIIYEIAGSKIFETGLYGQWSKDGRMYLYLSIAGKPTDLMGLHVADVQLETFANDIFELYGILDNGQLLVQWGDRSKSVLGTLDLDTKKRQIISDNISDFGDVNIQNDGHTILYMVAHSDHNINVEIINSDGSNHLPLAHSIYFLDPPRIINKGKSLLFYGQHDNLFSLEMIDLDGSNHRVFTTGLEDVERDIAWSNGPNGPNVDDDENADYIAFAGKRNGLLTVELVNLHTGDHHILAQGFANIDGLGPDSQFGGISFYWEYANHEDGFDAYTMEGKTVFHLNLPGDYLYESDYQVFSYLPSPDKNVVALRENNDVIKLYLIASDSSWLKPIAADLGGLGGGSSYTQAWSPDGKEFAFFANDPIGQSIHILDKNGDELHRFTGFATNGDGELIWTHCQ